jgi:hypothetical protein
VASDSASDLLDAKACELRRLLEPPRKNDGDAGSSDDKSPKDPEVRRKVEPPKDPEVRKNIEILASRLSDAAEVARRGALGHEPAEHILDLAEQARQAPSLVTLLEARRLVEQSIIQRADADLLREWTAAEFAEKEGTLTTWRRRYGDDLPEILDPRRGEPSIEVARATRHALQQLVAERFALYRPIRARRDLRLRSLPVLAGVVSVVAVLFAAAIAVQPGAELRTVFVGAAAGAAGASLSGLIKFRDEVRLGSEVREFTPFYLAQTLVGGVFGLLVVLLGESGWIALEDNVFGIGAISFAAGFSEPFALGIVARLTETSKLGAAE